MGDASPATNHSGPEFNAVLVPLDGSASMEAAIGLGAALAERSGATLHLAAVVRPGEAKLDLGEGVEIAQPGSREYAPILDEHVERLAQGVRRRHSCEVEATMIDADDPLRALSDYERRADVGITVMGVHVPRPSGETALAATAIRDAPSPLLFLPLTERDETGDRSPPVSPAGSVGVFATTTEPADELIRCAVQYARLWEADLRILVDPHASPDGNAPPAEGMQRLVDALADAGTTARPLHLEHGDDLEGLLEELHREGVGTVVTGFARKSLAERLLFESQDARDRPMVLVCPS